MTLYAKSARDGRQLTLLQHLIDTEQAAMAVFRAGTRQAERYLKFFKVPASEHPRFLLNLRVAGLFHDVGKANQHFQAMISHQSKGMSQPYRHEHLSALLLCEPSVRAWLTSSPMLDVDAITAAVLSHHLKASPDGKNAVLENHSTANRSELAFDDAQVAEAFVRVATIAELPRFTLRTPSLRYYIDDAWQASFNNLFDQAQAFARQQKRSPQRWTFALALKAGLIVADSVASGMWRVDEDMRDWVDGALHRPHITADDLDHDILEPRRKELKSKWNGWHSFQEGAATVGTRGLLLAGCGAGKTLAAWRWAKSVVQTEHVGRIIFLYPTRGTATEGFRDYVAHAPEGESALVHGTSAYELKGMQENPPESMDGKSFEDEGAQRLFSLGLWDKRYFSATVDQFLGFIEHSYGGLCLLPALADAAIVFDEVHSYDAKMWNALVTLLKQFDVPALCMTATLPSGRREELLGCGLAVYPTAEDMMSLRDLEEKETRVRYKHVATTRDAALEAAIDAVKNGERVLWVVNTVKRCQQLARELESRLDVPVGVYHSRFKLMDRQAKHRDTVDAFRGDAKSAAIAVTTQVCEMSLDLDADVLISEHAPISSLVQRFGRANRHLKRAFARLFTYAADAPAPYKKEELELSSQFLSELDRNGVSQRHLAEGLERLTVVERFSSGNTAFIDGGYYAVSGALRDEDDVGAAVVLDSDIAVYKKMDKAKDPMRAGLVLSVPRRKFALPNDHTGLPVWLKTADGSRYNKQLGFIVDDDLLAPPETA